jgi:hypothetical protein
MIGIFFEELTPCGTHVDAHRASGCLWQNQPTNFKKERRKRRNDLQPELY